MPQADKFLNLKIALRRLLGANFETDPLPDKGLAHWHVRLHGTGLLARIPKQSQMGLAPLENLAYEAACFQRAAPSGHVPLLNRVVAPSDELPWGALLVEEIVGSVASAPDQIVPIVQALASIHRLPVPTEPERAPILNEHDPLVGLLDLVRAQAVYLDHPSVSDATRRKIQEQLVDLCANAPRICLGLSRRLITFDAHPGNFLITPSGKAVLVDLEKLRYSYPPLDLAHATLYTSTTWDIDASFDLSTMKVLQTYESWVLAAGDIAQSYLPALVPLRVLMWLWSVTWCAKWLTESVKSKVSRRVGGQDWSQEHSDVALVEHVHQRVEDYLAIKTIRRMLAEFDELDELLAHPG